MSLVWCVWLLGILLVLCEFLKCGSFLMKPIKILTLIYSVHTVGKCDSLKILSEICQSPTGILISCLRDYLLPLCPLFFHSGPSHWSTVYLMSYLCILTHLFTCIFLLPLMYKLPEGRHFVLLAAVFISNN